MRQLEERIKQLRKKMVAVGLEKGFTHAETVKLSQQLDKLIDRVQQEK